MHDLYPFQEEVVELVRSGYHPLVTHQCGLGKTVTAIECVKSLDGTVRARTEQALVLALKSSFDQWVDELVNQDSRASVQILRRGDPVSKHATYVITNYETLLHKPTFKELEKTYWLAIIADEAHMIKNRKTKRAKALKKLSAYRRIALTGTPIEKSPADMWSILNWTRPDKYTSYWSFVNAFVETELNWLGHKVLKGPKNLDHMKKVVGHDVHRVTKAQAAPWLPPVSSREIHVPMTDRQAKLYKELEEADDIIADVGDKRLIIPNTLAHLVRLQQMASHPQLLGFQVMSGKEVWLKEFLESNPDMNVLVFSRFRYMPKVMSKVYDAHCILGGQENTVPKGAPLVFGTIGAMGTALSMGWMDVAIFWDVDRSATNMTQAEERIHRLNSTTPKEIIYLSASETIDSLLLESVQKKWSDADLVYQYLQRRSPGT